MPTVEQILAGLKDISNTWRLLAIFWHIYFAIIATALIIGIRPSKRICGILLGIPFLSVSIIAWTYFNIFNGIVFAAIGILLIYVSFKFFHEKIQIASLWIIVPGIILFIFGWVYPHFLDTSNYLPYLYSAPSGVIPCATLSIVIGLVLIMNSLNSSKFSLILGFTGLFYGITGVAQLGILIDWILLLGSVLLVILAVLPKSKKA